MLMGRLVSSGRSAITEVPAARWNVQAQHSALPEPIASRVRHGGFVCGAQLADNAAFSVSPAEAAAMDPCQRLLLERGYAALHASRQFEPALSVCERLLSSEPNSALTHIVYALALDSHAHALATAANATANVASALAKATADVAQARR